MKLDIVDVYSSISKKLLKSSLAFANKSTEISEQKIKIIINTSKSVLYNKEVWIKRKNNIDENELSDIIMGG